MGLSYEESYQRVLAEQGVDSRRKASSSQILPPESASESLNAMDASESSRITREYLAHYFGSIAASSFSSPAWRQNFGEELQLLDQQFGENTDAEVKGALAVGRNIYRIRTVAIPMTKRHIDVIQAAFTLRFILGGYRALLRSEWREKGPESPFFDPKAQAVAERVRQSGAGAAPPEMDENEKEKLSKMVGRIADHCRAVRVAIDHASRGTGQPEATLSEKEAAEARSALSELDWKTVAADMASLSLATGFGFLALDENAELLKLRAQAIALSSKLSTWGDVAAESMSPKEAEHELARSLGEPEIAGGRILPPIEKESFFRLVGSLPVSSLPASSPTSLVYAPSVDDLREAQDDPDVSPWFESTKMMGRMRALEKEYSSFLESSFWNPKDEARRAASQENSKEAFSHYAACKAAGMDALLGEHAPIGATALKTYFFNEVTASMALQRYEDALADFYRGSENYLDELAREQGCRQGDHSSTEEWDAAESSLFDPNPYAAQKAADAFDAAHTSAMAQYRRIVAMRTPTALGTQHVEAALRDAKHD